ncbi:trehalase family glycosidase [Proteiniborus sp. MB09-C3]|uniref:MGH1-like glycoside hydrolase domain-containing protein n=1 Tax=Proteiniborus sp. MB09-C3 TaxID=3050072 RepID=UPI0025577050|nr:trehalase family glycosidase [Proteiniborus sp. MB09-C3]WIV11640.1 trehalase family glycosidase [Proteiniborus sp. MB09-C3]
MRLAIEIIVKLFACLFIVSTMVGCSKKPSLETKNIRYQFRDIVDVKGVPNKAVPDTNLEINPFSDMGAWHAYHLPGIGDKEYYGGFIGPLYIAQEYGRWLSKSFNRIKIYNSKNVEEIRLADCEDIDLSYYPGLLVQRYNMKDLTLNIELRFVTNRTALVTTRIQNKTNKDLNLKLSWDGELLEHSSLNDSKALDIKLEACKNGVKAKFPNVNWTWDAFTSNEMEYEVIYPFEVDVETDGRKYIIEIDEISIKPEKEYTINTANTYTFTVNEKDRESEKIANILKNPLEYIKDNELRWEKYLKNTLKGENRDYDKLIVKTMETLITNWRSPAGAIKRDGITPSISYKWFSGMWAWDSWKQAVAVTSFAPELAKDNIRAIFDYQRDDGMVIDAIFYNKNEYNYPGEKGRNWNERNSKPPLAAWAVWEVYESSGDKSFLEEMYPKLVNYHNWWYIARDNDKNGIAEYGGSVDALNNTEEEIIRAAAWESGMDNAVRFDMDYGVRVLENINEDGELIGYSINQESVDLNSYLYAEKRYLERIAEVLNKASDANKYKKEAEYVKNFIQRNMFDEETGFFYDVDIDTKKPLVNRGKGIEGAIPLWAEAASKKQAEMVKNILVDETKFNTKVPFPTASKDNERYEPERYWRGPVWLDQAYFAVKGLKNNGYEDEAKELAKKIVENIQGGMVDGEVIRENYNPENGEGLHCTNFSWSAGMLLLLCMEYLI